MTPMEKSDSFTTSAGFYKYIHKQTNHNFLKFEVSSKFLNKNSDSSFAQWFSLNSGLRGSLGSPWFRL